MASGKDELSRLLATLNAQAEKANRSLERIEASLTSPAGSVAADAIQQLSQRLDRIERLMQEAVGELRAFTILTAGLTRRFEEELEDLRAQVTANGEEPEGGSGEEPPGGPSRADD
jgi:ABC-type transporter Mla subunit MlaD